MNTDGRQDLIAEFFEKSGGVPQLAHDMGVSQNTLRVCKHRGVLSKANKFEFMEAANKIGFALPYEIFEAVKPEGV